MLAFVACAVDLAIDPEKRVAAHHATSAKLWLVGERFRGLLAEIQDQLVDVSAITARRDALLHDLAHLFEHASPADGATHAIMKTVLASVEGGGYSDLQVDQFLPVSMRRARVQSS